MRKLLCLFALIFCLSSPCQSVGTGAYQFSTLESLGFDQINLGNLNVRFNIPLISRSGRGMAFNYAIQYEGLVWAPVNVNGTTTWQNDPNWGFQGQLNGSGFSGYLTYRLLTLTNCPRPPNTSGPYANRQDEYSNFVYHDPYGASHHFNYTILEPCDSDLDGTATVTGDGSSNDGSGYSFLSTWQVKSRDGRTIMPVVAQDGTYSNNITDSNGNQITSDGSVFTDTLGVHALTIGGAGTYNQPKTFTYPVTRQGASNATTATATIFYTYYFVTTNFGCSGVQEVGQDGQFAANFPDHIVLANGDTYSFGYELTPGFSGRITGRLATITLPTGGVIHYSYLYGCGAGMNPDGTPGSLKRALDDGTTRMYARSPIAGTTGTSTTVTDETGNDTYYAFAIDSATGHFYQNHKHVFQGPLANNVPLTDQYTCYNGATAACDGNPVILPITTVSTLNSYDFGNQYATTSHYSTNGLLIDRTDELNRVTSYTYNDNAEVLSAVTTLGDSQISRTSYGYDETAPISTGTNIVQHTGVTGVRGNRTSSHIWTGTNTLDTTTTYYDTGVPKSTTTPSGTTTYGYDGTQGFVTGTNLPTPTSGIALSTGASYDASSSALLSSTGVNAETTTVTAYDPLMRATQIAPPLGGGTLNISYGPNKMTTSQAMNGSQSQATETFFDSYGRIWRKATQTDNGWYITDTCFDTNGRTQYVSQPVLVGSDAASNVCHNPNVVPYSVYAYDALGRLKTFADFDGTTNTYNYNSYAVKVQDTNGVARIIQHDPTGRTTAVCEISSNAQNGISPGNCSGMDIAGTGFTTTYTYNDVAHSVTVAQGAQTRVFTTDAAGRLSSQQEPESGTTSYSYAYNGTGLVVTRKRPKANQTTSLLTTTTTQYDSIGRVITIRYDDGVTPNKTFVYDIASDGGINNYGASKGRLVQAQTDSPWAATWFYYDQMGRVTRTLQCFPDHCGGAGWDVNRWYNYDLAGNDTKETFLMNGCCGTPIDIDMAYTGAGELAHMSNTLTGPSNAEGGLLANIAQTPFGPQSYTYGNNLNGFRVYDPVGRNWGRYLCSGAGAFQCQGATQLHGTQAAWTGVRVNATDDTIVGHRDFGYDEFNRLTSANVVAQGENFSYTYDLYGNRLGQTATGSGGSSAPQASFSINAANNQIIASGYNYDAAGNLLGDHVHTYKYDAENNLIAADGETYYYDALNHRVQMASSGYRHDIAYDAKGRRVSMWDGAASGTTMLEANFYWNDQPIAHWTPGVTSSFDAIHATGVRDASISAACGTIWDLNTSALSSTINYQIRGGDTLEYDHLGRVGQGGMYLHFSSGAYSLVNSAGEDPTDYAPDGSWHHEVLSLNPWATSVVVGLTMGVQASTPTTGQWDLYLSNAFIRSTDGSVHPLYSGGSITTNLWSDCGGRNLAVTTDTMTNGGTIHFQHQDILGTERLRTNASGAVEGRYLSLPFGDGFSVVGTDDDPHHFAGLDQDATGTQHAQFRQYSSVQGRWMSPDPYAGSYDLGNPQSLNRYVYVLNNPVMAIDPSGLYAGATCGGGNFDNLGDCGAGCNLVGSCNGDRPGSGGGTAGPDAWGGDYYTGPTGSAPFSDPFDSISTVCASNGCYSYGQNIWDNIMGNGPGEGIAIDGINIDCGVIICGHYFQSLLGMPALSLSNTNPSGGGRAVATASNPSPLSQGHTSKYYRCTSALLARATFAGLADAKNKFSLDINDALSLGRAAAPSIGVTAAAGAELLGATLEGAAVVSTLASGVAEVAAVGGVLYVAWNSISAASDYAEAHPCSD